MTAAEAAGARSGEVQQFVRAPPVAAALAEALRGFGYTPGTALADIVDNSIAAGSGRVRIDFVWGGGEPYISILDDGSGMDASGLEQAMVLGGLGPSAEREPSDLGRFGLGLKTASLSQCRSVTVASRKQSGDVTVRRWDLDHICRPDVNDWQLLIDPRPGSENRLDPVRRSEKGTLVLWEGLDRILERMPSAAEQARRAFYEIAEVVERHLAMVFHRYLDASNASFRIYMNGDDESRRVRAWDPFLTDNRATSRTPIETIQTTAGRIQIQGFVLPHRDRLNSSRFRDAAGPEGWTAQQGFYVYRNQRLLVAGSWLGLGEGRAWTKEEAHRLARLRLDLPNTADHEWDIDVRKSAARPPAYLKPRLRDLAIRTRGDARRVFAYRGTYWHTESPSDFRPLWKVEELRDGVRYLIDRDHPAVQRALGPTTESQALDSLLALVETTVPVRRIWLDAAERGEVQARIPDPDQQEKLGSIARELAIHLIRKCGFTTEDAIQQLGSAEPFNQVPDLVKEIVHEVGSESEKADHGG